ncbi:hypothetical protein EXW50_02365 [Bacillus mycoides]|nr:hypothetical protein EXW26_02360 [Bacillus mycoides]QWG72859.1 hypothetical protein EXW63_12010 [Bacillus mycoides]QWH21330.1 hypothetical protein EXW50_02365 [Bacillus mycoides]
MTIFSSIPSFTTRSRKIASAIGERQMFPRQTNNTRTIFLFRPFLVVYTIYLYSINNQLLIIKEIPTNLIGLKSFINENDKKMLR